MMNQIAAVAQAAGQRREGRAEHGGEVVAERLRPEHAELHNRQYDEIDSCHDGRSQHAAGNVPVGVLRLAHMTGRCLESRHGEADQIKSVHALPFKARNFLVVRGASGRERRVKSRRASGADAVRVAGC